MKRTTKHVALDVHQATTVASVRESGRVIARSVLPTDAAPILEFFRGMRGTIHVAFEEGTQAQRLRDLSEATTCVVPVRMSQAIVSRPSLMCCALKRPPPQGRPTPMRSRQQHMIPLPLER